MRPITILSGILLLPLILVACGGGNDAPPPAVQTLQLNIDEPADPNAVPVDASLRISFGVTIGTWPDGLADQIRLERVNPSEIVPLDVAFGSNAVTVTPEEPLSCGAAYRITLLAPVTLGGVTANEDVSRTLSTEACALTATFTISGTSFTFDGTPKTPTVTVSPAEATFDVWYESVGYARSNTPPTETGVYTLQAIAREPYVGSATDTFIIRAVDAKPVTITFTGSGSTFAYPYDGNPKPLDEFVTTSPSDVAVLLRYGDPASTTAPTNAGTYPVTVTANDPDYIGSATATLVISPIDVTVSMTSDSVTYGDTYDVTPSVTDTSGLFDYALLFQSSDTGSYDSTTSPTNAGTYDVTLAAPEGETFDNFDITYVNNEEGGTLTIAKKPVEFAWGSVGTYTYDGTEQGPGYTATPTDGVVVTDGTATDADTYTAKVTLANGNYELSSTDTNDVSWTIEPKVITIAWNISSPYTYNGSNQGPTYTADPDEGVKESGTHQATNVDDYTATVEAESSNYTLTSTDALSKDWSITKRQVTISWSNSTPYTYNESSQGPTFTTSPGDLATLSGAPKQNVGDYEATATLDDTTNNEFADGAQTTADYEITALEVSFSWEDCNDVTYNGSSQGPSADSASSSYVDVSGNSNTAAGDYTASVSLGDSSNYVWSGGTEPQDCSYTIHGVSTVDITASTTDAYLDTADDSITITLTAETGSGTGVTGLLRTDFDFYVTQAQGTTSAGTTQLVTSSGTVTISNWSATATPGEYTFDVKSTVAGEFALQVIAEASEAPVAARITSNIEQPLRFFERID